MARKPAALARELLRNFPKGRRGSKRRRRKSTGGEPAGDASTRTSPQTPDTDLEDGQEPTRDLDLDEDDGGAEHEGGGAPRSDDGGMRDPTAVTLRIRRRARVRGR